MTYKNLRNFVFALHCYIGLGVGLIAIIVGLTGSLLVFQSEISDFQRHKQIGTITPQGEMLPIEVVVNTVKKSYTNPMPSLTEYMCRQNQIRYKFPQEIEDDGNSDVYLNQYSGKVLRVDNALKPSLGDRILNSFTPLHFGTFGGLPTRILYVFVGLAPLILFITGFVMWQYRKRPITNLPTEAMPIARSLFDRRSGNTLK
ncbi:PepSY-associated TM helix domain-containing protein [Nostoc sp.]|uniref:PepSY-associated TM helix domain-containing protein n=1 Tax=Nostoc sp. TaxID=1180 RepID=UPI002FF526DD